MVDREAEKELLIMRLDRLVAERFFELMEEVRAEVETSRAFEAGEWCEECLARELDELVGEGGVRHIRLTSHRSKQIH